jgi:hypothetical protein
MLNWIDTICIFWWRQTKWDDDDTFIEALLKFLVRLSFLFFVIVTPIYLGVMIGIWLVEWYHG